MQGTHPTGTESHRIYQQKNFRDRITPPTCNKWSRRPHWRQEDLLIIVQEARVVVLKNSGDTAG